MSRVWFTSDTHYFHRNIAGPKVSRWKSGYRDFEDEKQMSQHIVEQINKHVKEDDILYHLGDWSFGGIVNIWNFRKQINCKNVHLILGNHDHHIENNAVLPNVMRSFENNNLYEGYFDKDRAKSVRAREVFSSIQHIKKVKHEGQTFFLSHFAHRVWDKSHHGVIHLYGHSHASIDDSYGKSMDVGIDNARKLLGEYRPFSIEEIIEIMSNREILSVDHHNSETND